MSLYDIIDKDIIMRSGFTKSVLDSSEPPKRWGVPKKNGGVRIIHHPSSKNKLLQYWLITKVLCKFPVHQSAFAFIKKRSIKDNALLHAKSKNNYFVKVDIKDFFPSLNFSDFERSFHKYRNLIDISNEWDDELLHLMKETCFIPPRYNLPIGFPTSPLIANFVAREIDESITNSLMNYEASNPIYTRYADDIIVSVSEKGLSKSIIKLLQESIDTSSLGISINKEKVRICSASGGSVIATGLKICHDHHITLHKKMKDSIRLKLSLYSKGILDTGEINKLSGYIAYAKSIDEHFYTKINRKYFLELTSLENKHLATDN